MRFSDASVRGFCAYFGDIETADVPGGGPYGSGGEDANGGERDGCQAGVRRSVFHKARHVRSKRHRENESGQGAGAHDDQR